jgi:hypothetical protein
MPIVMLLSLDDEPCAGSAAAGAASVAGAVRVPVLECADALRAHGAGVELVTATSDEEIDAAVKAAEAGHARLVVAAATDAEVRAVVRRLVRRHAPPPSRRPAELPEGRTVFDLPALGLLPLAPAQPDLVGRLGLPRRPADVAAAVLAGRSRRLDLLRTDGGSVTLHGCLLGGRDAEGRVMPWRGRVEVDDVVLSDGTDPLIACSIRASGGSDVDGLPLVESAPPDDGAVHVAVAVPLVRSRLIGRAPVRFEVRRARGRAVSVAPAGWATSAGAAGVAGWATSAGSAGVAGWATSAGSAGVAGDGVPQVDDGIAGVLTRRRAWWVEPGCWAVYVNELAS